MIQTLLIRLGIDHLHYMSPMDNVPSILARGILSYNQASALPHRSVALSSVQMRRNAAVVPGTNRRIHDYVPLYFSAHTPMQYIITHAAPTKGRGASLSEDELVILEIDAAAVFVLPGVVFTDGNAASAETRFFSQVEDLQQLNWANINLPNAYPQCYDKAWQREKAAEVLVPDKFLFSSVTRTVVHSVGAKSQLETMLQSLVNSGGTYLTSADVERIGRIKCEVDITHYFS